MLRHFVLTHHTPPRLRWLTSVRARGIAALRALGPALALVHAVDGEILGVDESLIGVAPSEEVDRWLMRVTGSSWSDCTARDRQSTPAGGA